MNRRTRALCWAMTLAWVGLSSLAIARPPEERRAVAAKKARMQNPAPARLPFGDKEIQDSRFGVDGLNMYENERVVPKLAEIGAHWGRHPRTDPVWMRTVNEDNVPDYADTDRGLAFAYEHGIMFTGDFDAFFPRGGPGVHSNRLPDTVTSST